MILIDKIEAPELHKIQIACAYLFSPQLAGDEEFLKSLDAEMLKKAFRKKAKRYHPDFHCHEQKKMINMRTERFIRIQEAYEILSSHLQVEPLPFLGKADNRGKIIAIGGSKGGIGKSLFAANLGVLLSHRGLRTMLVDLDLGGANLHLYLGETSLKRNINDFLNKRVASLQKIMIRSKYGPQLIGGDSSQLGAANIHFSQKLRLLKAIKRIDADYVIIDLGGDTTYNIIDFFLSADHGIIMTTCDPAAYLDAYNFIKTSLYRKLNRLFGPESKLRAHKDRDLEKSIHDLTMSTNGSKTKSIEELMERLKKFQSRDLSIIKGALSTFNPSLIVNRVPNNFDVSQVVKRIREVSRKMLSIKAEYLGSLPYQSEIELSARELVPIVARYPKGSFAREKMGPIVEHLLRS